MVNAEEKFLKALKGVTDPEKKRKIIGRAFIKVFEENAKRIKEGRAAAQKNISEMRKATSEWYKQKIAADKAAAKIHKENFATQEDMKESIVNTLSGSGLKALMAPQISAFQGRAASH